MKIAPIIHELKTVSKEQRNKNLHLSWKLVHTGQHYDYEMSKVFFDDFDIPEPDYFLNVGSGSHAEQTAKIMIEFEKVCLLSKKAQTLL
jgi:UDP-N-acetylglucosamine 2-epimerase (non-hydrolysing)